MCRIQGVHGSCWNLWLKTAERSSSGVKVSLIPISKKHIWLWAGENPTSDRPVFKFLRQSVLPVTLPGIWWQCQLSITPCYVITHIWISEVLGHRGNGLLISNGTTVSTTEIRTLQGQPHSSSHFWLIPTTLCRTPGLQRGSITCPSPCAQANPCSKGCSVTSPTRLIGFKSKCLLWFLWAIRGQIWHPLLLSLSHSSADIVEVLGEFQVVTCNLAVHSQGLLSAHKAATSQGKADSCSSKEPLKPLFNHLILLLVPLSISFFFFFFRRGGGRKQMQFCLYLDFQNLLDLFKIH